MTRLAVAALALAACSCWEVSGGCGMIEPEPGCVFTIDPSGLPVDGLLRLRVYGSHARQGEHGGVCWEAREVRLLDADDPGVTPGCDVLTIATPRRTPTEQ